MKLNYIFALLIYFLCAVSCTDNAEPERPLVGTWIVMSHTWANCDDPLNGGTYNYTCEEDDCTTYTFYADGTFQESQRSGGYTRGTYIVSDNIVTICHVELEDQCEASTFLISGDNLTLARTEDEDISGCAFSMSLMACSSCVIDESEEDPLVGTWILEERTTSACTDPEDDKTESYLCDENTCASLKFSTNLRAIMEFKNYQGISGIRTGSYNNADDKLEVCLFGIECTKGTYELVNDGETLNYYFLEEGCSVFTSYVRQ